MHYEVKRMQKAYFKHIHIHQRILNLHHQSYCNCSSTANLPIACGNNVNLVKIGTKYLPTRHWLADWCDRCSIYCHMIVVLVHQRILSIYYQSCYNRCNTMYVAIMFANKKVSIILSMWPRI